MPHDELLLHVEGVRKRFGGVQALDDVSFDVFAGQVHCLAGENGSGKSTLIKIVSGAEAPDEGTITVLGHTRRIVTPRAAIRDGVQVIYQDLSMFPNLTVAENIALGPAIASGKRSFSVKRARAVAQEAMDQIGVALPLDTQVADLPIAQRQLTAICRALAQDARVLFMDEPTTALTWREVSSLFDVVRRLSERGVGVVVVSHKLNEVLSISDQITVLRNGRVTAQGPASDFDRSSLSKAMTGSEIAVLDKRWQSAATAPPLLEVHDLSSPGTLHDVSFTLAGGEILGITGLLGSGREAIAEALFGIRAIDAGRIVIDGSERRINSVNDAIAAGIGYVPSDRLTEGLFLEHSVAQNVVAADIGGIPRRRGLVTAAAARDIGARLVHQLGIKTPSPDTAVRNLSGGNQQRVVLAKWLRRQPHVLMLNGPTVGVDIGSKREILTILRQLSDDGAGIIVISDDVPELVEVCDRILITRNGTVAVELDGADIEEDRVVRELVA